MIHQDRPYAPYNLPEELAWTAKYLADRQRIPPVKFKFPNPARKKLQPVLEKMTANHCSYCDGFPMGVLTERTIDHFFPRSRFPERAFAWDNLFLACHRCQSRKGQEHDPLLLKPDVRTYRFEKFFIYCTVTGELQPNPSVRPKDQKRARASIALLGLNSPELRADRKRWFRNQAGRKQDELPYRFMFPRLPKKVKSAMGTWEI